MTRLAATAPRIAALLSIGCSRPASRGGEPAGDEEQPRAEAPAEAKASAGDDPADLPDLRFADRLDLAKLPAADPPRKARPIAWSFAGRTEIEYDYRQEIVVELSDEPDPKRAELKALLSIAPRGDGTAEVTLRGGEAVYDEGQRAPVPEMTLGGVGEDGRKEDPGPEEWYLALLVALPARALAPGDTEEVPFAIPFDSFGKLLYGRAPLRLTRLRYVEDGGRRGALLESRVEVTGLDAPAGKAAPHFAVEARGLILYDLEERAIARQQLAATLRLATALDDEDVDMIQHHFIELSRRRAAR